MSLYLKGVSKAALSVSLLASQSSLFESAAGPSCQLQNGAINRKAGSLLFASALASVRLRRPAAASRRRAPRFDPRRQSPVFQYGATRKTKWSEMLESDRRIVCSASAIF